ncbi:hypothetical protein MRB53_021027 [Persea americana]|uniref:Uncharacterized protein n=1 Tax=Persea americana TaxID=3435 RepID=A0ACC2L2S2_PERAE|nr:hypothetical protein MRB53_021027 [Persea americana]
MVPLGFRFDPTDEELIYYLWIKNNGWVLPSDAIMEYNVYACNPDQLPRHFNHRMGNDLYFFTTRERKYLKGSRPSRTAGDGFWKATSIEKKVLGGDQSIIGYKKTLVFYYKEKNKKTSWIMHEYRIDKTDGSIGKESLKMDGFVICRIYERRTKASKSDTRMDDHMIQSLEYDTRTPISSVQSAEGDAIELMQLCQGESNCFTDEMTKASKFDTRMNDHLILSFEYDTCTPISSLQSAEGDAIELPQLCEAQDDCFIEEMTKASKSDTRMDDHMIPSFEFDTRTPISSLQSAEGDAIELMQFCEGESNYSFIEEMLLKDDDKQGLYDIPIHPSLLDCFNYM